MYKSISTRHVSAQRYSEALDFLYSGASLQLTHEQVICGTELALLFAETLVKGKIPYDDKTLARVREIYDKFPRIPLPQHVGDEDDMHELSKAIVAAKTWVDGCSSFLKAAIRWSAGFGANSHGSPELHIMLAEYMYSESPEVCYSSEDDLAIAQAVLRYLSAGNLRDANMIMEEIKNQIQSTHIEFPQTELMLFISFLLQTMERDALPLFNMLRVKYKPSTDRVPAFNDMLDEIVERFYGVQRRRNPMGMFGDIFKVVGRTILIQGKIANLIIDYLSIR